MSSDMESRMQDQIEGALSQNEMLSRENRNLIIALQLIANDKTGDAQSLITLAKEALAQEYPDELSGSSLPASSGPPPGREFIAAHNLAYELGGTEDGNYLLTPDDLDKVVRAAASSGPEQPKCRHCEAKGLCQRCHGIGKVFAGEGVAPCPACHTPAPAAKEVMP